MGGLVGTVDIVQGYHADLRIRPHRRPAASGQSKRSKVTVQITSSAAPALCSVARPRACQNAPWSLRRRSAAARRLPAGRQSASNGRLWARARVDAPTTIKIKPKAGADSVRDVNGDARGVREHAAGVVDVQSAPQHEGVAKVHLRPPRLLAGGKIRTGHRRIIGAGPAAERDLQRERGKSHERKLSQRQFAAGRSRRSA